MMYVSTERLTTSIKEKVSSFAGSIIITSGLLLITFFLKITAPDPPFEPPKSILEVDFGIVDGGFGNPDAGGPSPNPPAQGGAESGGSESQNAGGANHITGEDESNSAPTGLPPINQTTSTAQSKINAALKNRGKGGSTSAGVPNGWPGGTGTTGSGGGTIPGVQGSNTGNKVGQIGDGKFSSSFISFNIRNTVRKIDANGTGTIVSKVRIDCDGSYHVITYGDRGTNYNGNDINKVVNFFLSNASITKKTDGECPEISFVSMKITKELE